MQNTDANAQCERTLSSNQNKTFPQEDVSVS